MVFSKEWKLNTLYKLRSDLISIRLKRLLLVDVLIDDCMDAGGRAMQEQLAEKKRSSSRAKVNIF